MCFAFRPKFTIGIAFIFSDAIGIAFFFFDNVLQLRKRPTDNVLRFKTPNVPWLFPSVLGGYDHNVPRLICSLGTGFNIVPWSFVSALGGYDQLGVWSMFYTGWGIL